MMTQVGVVEAGCDCFVKGNTPSMDLRDRLEIYIPAEAEVRSIPLWSLPNSVLRRMNIPLADANGSKKLTNSPKGTWICPAVVRKKGQIQGPQTGSGVIENTFSLLSRECRASSGPFRMSFLFSNRTAYRVLKDTLPGNSTPLPHTPPLPHGPATRTFQHAVVIYAGRIYLSVRKPSRSQAQRETPQSAVLPFPTVHRQVKRQKKELLNDNKPKKKRPTCKVTQGPNKKGVTHKISNISSSKTARSVPQSTVHCHEDARAEQATEEPAVQRSDWFQPQEEEVVNNDSGGCERQDLRSEEAESISDMDGNLHTDSAEAEQSSSQSRSRREAEGAACASTSLQNEFDFEELDDEEKITKMKAKLKQKEAALSSFPSL